MVANPNVLADKCRTEKDPLLRESLYKQLIAHYQNQVITIIKSRCKHVTGDVTESEEWGVGLRAFHEAVEKYEIDRGFQFSTLLQHNVEIHLHRHMMGYYYGVHCFAVELPCDALQGLTSEDYDVDSISRSQGIHEAVADETPVYRRLDMDDEIEANLTHLDPKVIFGVKVIAGLIGFGRLGRLGIYKLIGSENKDALNEAVAALHLN